jgi:pimeloyl-ACP methyl ester carboxylesterase
MRWILILSILIVSGCVNGEMDIEVEDKGYEVIDVALQTSDGITIKGSYYNASEEDAPGVILIHMLSRNRGDWREFARALQASDYAVLAIDLRGHGESDLDWREFMPGDGFKGMVLDVAAAKDYLVEEGVRSSEIVIVGGSIGANVALNYAAEDNDIKGIVLLSPGLDYNGVVTEEAIVTYGERPVLIIASEGDTYSADSSRKLYSLAKGDSKIKIYPADAHGTWILQAQDSSSMIIDWIQERL